MTSFAFILGVVPLVLATGAGASARKSIGITVFTGMIASTCLAVLFVPTFFVVIQRFENWLGRSGEGGADEPRRRRCALRRVIARRSCRAVERALHVDRPATSAMAREPASPTELGPYTFTIRLPRFSPASSPISACGVFSRPLMTSSCTFSLPEATQDCRSFSAWSRWFM